MALDLCRPIKFECPSEGGSQTDIGPTEVNALQDALTAAGYFIQGPSLTSQDRVVLLDRITGGNLRLTDAVTSHVLGELVSSTTGQVGSHNKLLDVVHFLQEGPGDGWASGAVAVDNYSGPLRTSTVWYTDANLAKKIVGIVWGYAGPLVQTETLSLYNADGATVARKVVDTYTYTGPLRAQRIRTWS